ncbi:MAG: hypothetical protein PUB21_11685 [Bacteroidales bacterium]|nr:hypothetical protein [Bacteroidales bacterium]
MRGEGIRKRDILSLFIPVAVKCFFAGECFSAAARYVGGTSKGNCDMSFAGGAKRVCRRRVRLLRGEGVVAVACLNTG